MTTQLQLQHFAVLTLTKIHLTGSILLYCTTNNPCHLSCYYTKRRPGIHRTTRLLRGSGVPWGAYWCFVGWTFVPQLEAGDTLTHTFIVPDWTIYHTKWFAFRGTVAGQLSPSASCIFEWQHTGLDLILNPSFEDWSAPSGDAPDHWAYPPSPHHNVNYKDDEIKVDRHYSCRTDNPTLYGNFYLWQELDPTLLSNLPFTFRMAYRGKNLFTNNLFIRAEGDVIRQGIAFPTKEYEWEYFNIPLTMPSNLTRLYIRAQNWNQGFPLPFQTWHDNCLVYYTP